MARLLADENFPFPATQELRRHGHDVATLEELEQSDRSLPDEAVLALASGQGRAVVTLNRRDFIRLHGQNADHSGIVVCSFDLDSKGLADRITAALDSGVPLRGHLVRIHRPSRP